MENEPVEIPNHGGARRGGILLDGVGVAGREMGRVDGGRVPRTVAGMAASEAISPWAGGSPLAGDFYLLNRLPAGAYKRP